jgi:signal transduction histidine kinase
MLGLAAEKLRDSDDAAVAPLIHSSIETLRTALRELRDLSRGVYPFLLSEEGLVPAVQSLVGRSVVPIALRSDPLPSLGPELETTAYFVIAEAVTNALKHAQATQITVDIRCAGARLTLTVTDDGIGLADAANGSALHGLRTRVASLGGTLATRSAPSTGSTVIASFRIDDQA